MTITDRIVTSILNVIDAGLSANTARTIPGHMCIGASIRFALNEPHGFRPPGVSSALTEISIILNDAGWSCNAARARGLRRLAIAQLGTNTTFDEQEFVAELSKVVIGRLLPPVLRASTALQQESSSGIELLQAAHRCESKQDWDSLRLAQEAASRVHSILHNWAIASAQKRV